VAPGCDDGTGLGLGGEVVTREQLVLEGGEERLAGSVVETLSG